MASISPCPWEEGVPEELFSGACTVPRFNDGGVSIPPWSVGEGPFGEGFRENVWVGVGVGREAGLCVAVVGARGTIGCGSDLLLTGGKNCWEARDGFGWYCFGNAVLGR